MKKERVIYNYDYLKEQIKDYLKYYNIKLKDLAIKIGISERTLKRTLNNERYFYVNEIYHLIDELHIPKDKIELTFFNRINPISSESKK